MEASILLVEDDRRLRRGTAMGLEQEGFRVLEAPDADVALRLLAEQNPDLAIFDVMLPGQDGFELCRKVRKTNDLPVIFLTAKTNTVDVVVGLESGGDDYVTKPFVMRELIARIRALLRRLQSETPLKRINVGDLLIEPETGVVRRGDEPVSLTKTEFKLICTLASRPNVVFKREVLLEQVWGYDYLGDSRLVDTHIQRLRAKIEPDPSNPTHIQTLRGLGYKLVAEP
ncbi:MAG TPA: response regulator transcription factor [Actinomycetota bacterium]|nr:response regulator transcription factor [Actinomycetota bacterium]